VFARDDVSLDYLQGLKADARIIRSVDFTIGLVPSSIEPLFDEPFAAIVPNAKLVTSGTTTRDRYVEVLRGYVAVSRLEGLRPVVVVHEDGDRDIADELAALEHIAVLADPDPLVLKAMLAQAAIVVASRFHAVVGALAMGVPSVALGWSHKYAELVSDFGVPTWVTRLEADAHETFRAVLNDDEGKRAIRAVKSQLVGRVDAMWSTTIAAIS